MDVTSGKSSSFDSLCAELQMPENRVASKVNQLLLEESRLVTDKLLSVLENEKLLDCDLEQCERVIKQALETICIVGVEYGRLWTKPESVEMAHLVLKRRLQAIKSLRKRFDQRLKVFAALKNETFDAKHEFNELTYDIFDAIDCLDLDGEADWQLAIEAYNEQFEEVKSKARLAEIRHQLDLGPAPKAGEKRAHNAVTDEQIESWTYEDTYAKVPSRLVKKNGRVPCEWYGCASDFSHNKNMKEHYVTVHMNIYKKLKCLETGCNQIFKSYNALANHKRQNHGAEKLKCNQCNFMTNFATNLCHHTKEKHSDDHPVCKICELKFNRQDIFDTHIKQDHSLTGDVFSRQLEAVLKGDDEAKAILEAGRKDAEYVKQLFVGESNHKSGNYFLYETTVESFEFTAESIKQMDYAGKFTEVPHQPHQRPKAHASEFKNFITNGFDNPTKKLRLMKEQVDKGAEFTYKTFFNKKPAQFSAIVETSIIHAIGKTNLFNDKHGANLPQSIPWHNDLKRIARLGTYFIHKMILDQ